MKEIVKYKPVSWVNEVKSSQLPFCKQYTKFISDTSCEHCSSTETERNHFICQKLTSMRLQRVFIDFKIITNGRSSNHVNSTGLVLLQTHDELANPIVENAS